MEKVNPPPACLRRIGSIEEDHKLIKLTSAEFVIGRAKEADYAIPNVVVSRRHAIFRYHRNQWTIESVGMNGVTLNHVLLPENQQIPLNHMDTIELGAGSKFLYAFRVQALESVCEPNAKRPRIPLANHNVPTLKESPLAFKNWVKSRKSLEITLSNESNTIDLKLEQQKSRNEELIKERKKLEENAAKIKKELESKFAQERRELEDKVARGDLEKNELQKEKENLEMRMVRALEEFQEECKRKTKDLEDSLAKANTEKKRLLEEKEFIVQQLTREKDLLQERLREESRLRAATLDELAKLKESRESLERQWQEERRRFEEDMKQMQLKESEDETRLSRLSSELAERKAQLDAKEKEVAEIQSRAAIGLEMFEAIQVIQQENPNNADIMIVLDEGKQEGAINQSQGNSAEVELERVRQELRIQMELKKQELEQVSRQARQDILGKIESVLENELQCAICSELMVHATSLSCMHTFCQYCINVWKKNRAECPQCRSPITSEGRNLVVDNMIEAMLTNMSEEVQKRRKELVEVRKALVASQQEQKRNSQNRNGTRRPRQEAVPRSPAQRRTLPANHAHGRMPAARVLVLAASGTNPAISADTRTRPTRTASRQSIAVLQPDNGAARHAQPVHLMARTGAQRLAAVVVQPTANPRHPAHPISVASRQAQAPLVIGRPQRRRVRLADSDVVVISSGSDESSNEDAFGNNSIMVIDEHPARPRTRARRISCQQCGRSITSRRCNCAHFETANFLINPENI